MDTLFLLLMLGGLIYLTWQHVYFMEKFKAQAFQKQKVQYVDIKQALRQRIKHIIPIYGAFILLFFAMFVIGGYFELNELLLVTFLICPLGLLFFTLLLFISYLLNLKGEGLPFVNDETNE